VNLLDLLIAPAYAQAAAPAPGGFGMSLLFPILLIGVMYFLMIRPQMKRAKEHKAMLGQLAKGDEVLTNGGIAGVVIDLGENFITVEIADNVRIRVQRGSIANVLPKGTLKSA
jgi:preprotein translocase subunit YajC